MSQQTAVKKIFLSRERERELIANYQTKGCNESLGELMIAHEKYVNRLANKAWAKFNKVVELEDLIQQAQIGFMRAALLFDLNKTVENQSDNNKVNYVRFLTYAHNWMIAEMQNLWHHSNSVYIPAHTLRAIHFNLKNDDSNDEERKKLARLALRIESLDILERRKDNKTSDEGFYSGNTVDKKMAQVSGAKQDPTFEDGVSQVFSPMVKKAIDRLSEIEWRIVNLKLGLEDGFCHPYDQIKNILAKDGIEMSEKDIDKSYKRSKRILAKTVAKQKDKVPA